MIDFIGKKLLSALTNKRLRYFALFEVMSCASILVAGIAFYAVISSLILWFPQGWRLGARGAALLTMALIVILSIASYLKVKSVLKHDTTIEWDAMSERLIVPFMKQILSSGFFSGCTVGFFLLVHSGEIALSTRTFWMVVITGGAFWALLASFSFTCFSELSLRQRIIKLAADSDFQSRVSEQKEKKYFEVGVESAYDEAFLDNVDFKIYRVNKKALEELKPGETVAARISTDAMQAYEEYQNRISNKSTHESQTKVVK